MRRGSSVPFVLAAVVGVLGGWLWARRHDAAHRHDLFAGEPYRRFAALGWLASQDDAESVGLLQDYLAWETVPMLRQRARRVLTALERWA